METLGPQKSSSLADQRNNEDRTMEGGLLLEIDEAGVGVTGKYTAPVATVKSPLIQGIMDPHNTVYHCLHRIELQR